MIKLPALTKSWGQDNFDDGLQQALKKLPADQLPLKQLARYSGVFNEQSLQFSILNKDENDKNILVKLGVFYQELASLCPCSGEQPQSIDGHCEMMLCLNKQDGSTTFELL